MDLFIELGILIAASALISIVMRILRQPLIIGYIITGFIVGPYVFNIAQSEEVIRIFAELGIAFLLFIVGLNLSPKVFKEVGVPSLVTGLGQIVFTSVIGYIIVQLFGFDVLTSWYIAIALTFSSTIIILKLLSRTLVFKILALINPKINKDTKLTAIDGQKAWSAVTSK